MSEFSKFLLRVGEAREGTEPQNEDKRVHIDERFIVRGETFIDLATTFYSENKENYQNCDYITSRIMMCPKNDTTDQINEFEMDQILDEAKILLSADSVDSNQAACIQLSF